jgi:hypothetical protein
MTLDEFLSQLFLDLEDLKEDIDYDLPRDSVPTSKLAVIIKNVKDFQENE